jgi:hypothetical protein
LGKRQEVRKTGDEPKNCRLLGGGGGGGPDIG